MEEPYTILVVVECLTVLDNGKAFGAEKSAMIYTGSSIDILTK